MRQFPHHPASIIVSVVIHLRTTVSYKMNATLMNQPTCYFVLLFIIGVFSDSFADETLPPLASGKAPQNFAEMWTGFDPRDEALEVEHLLQWEEDGVLLRVVRFRIGVFRGETARLAAVYGFPKSLLESHAKVPGLLQIHGGGQYADYKACLANAKRGYATLSIAWAGRISAPGYRVSPAEVKLFWEGKTDDPNYKLTTDWGKLDGYHAPGRNAGNQFPSAKPASWTLDAVESPRNSGWFLCALAARRGLTFLERQPEVDAERLGVYGHSMGGKLSVMTAVDERVKAAAPSCGGISDRDNASELFRKTLGDDVSLRNVSCPIFFLIPSNDFHGRIGDLPTAISEIKTDDWRVTCSPHHNHQDTAEYEVATLLWMDHHLKKSFEVPQTPPTNLRLSPEAGDPILTISPEPSNKILGINVYYTQQGKADERPEDRLETMHRFWQHADANRKDNEWTAALPIYSLKKPLWVYANVKYQLDEPVSGAGYYYGAYTADSFNLTSLLTIVTPEQLQSAKVVASINSSTMIEDFQGDWEKEWFTYRLQEWARMTNKLSAAPWQAPQGASLALEVKSSENNQLVVLLDDSAAVIQLQGNDQWEQIVLQPQDFKNYQGESRSNWSDIRLLKLSPAEHLRPASRESGAPRLVGRHWKGDPPQFRNLQWKLED